MGKEHKRSRWGSRHSVTRWDFHCELRETELESGLIQR